LKALAVALCLSLLGCSKIERISQCRGLVETVNQGMDVIEPIAKAEDSPSKFEKLEREYRGLADRVSALPIASSPLHAEIKEYTELLKAVAEHCKNLQGAIGAGGRVEQLRKDLDRTTRREKMAIHKLETYCQAP
jgi:chromosome segregation ATPase